MRSYLFNKHALHFKDEEKDFACPDGQTHHSVSIINKKEKKGSSDDYATADWFKINSKVVNPKHASRLYRLTIFAGEIFRLIDINNSPKYRVFSEEKNPVLISKGIKNPLEYRSYYKKNDNNLYFEGMGRQFIIKIFLAENDNHTGNWYISISTEHNNHYFYTIDHGQCFSPWSSQFYNLSVHEPRSIRLTVSDYDNFPITHNYQPKSAIVDAGNISGFRNIRDNLLFLNEKHFTALKLLLTEELIQEFVDIHVINDDDNQFLKNMLPKRTLELNTVCQESKAFKDYLHKNRMVLLSVMLYEINEFFNHNRHYECLNINRTKHLSQIISRFNEILKDMQEVTLNTSENALIEKYLSMVANGELHPIKLAEKFYAEQYMAAYVNLAQKKLQAIQSNSDKNTLLKLKTSLTIEKKISEDKKYYADPQQLLFEKNKIKEINDRILHLTYKTLLKSSGDPIKRQLESHFLQEVIKQYPLKKSLVNAIEIANINIPQAKNIYKRSFFKKRNKTLDLIHSITTHSLHSQRKK